MNNQTIIYSEDFGDGIISQYIFKVSSDYKYTGKIEMRRFGSSWSNPGELVMTLTDNGNGLSITNNKKKLDYGFASELSMMLKFYYEDSGISDGPAKIQKYVEYKS